MSRPRPPTVAPPTIELTPEQWAALEQIRGRPLPAQPERPAPYVRHEPERTESWDPVVGR